MTELAARPLTAELAAYVATEPAAHLWRIAFPCSRKTVIVAPAAVAGQEDRAIGVYGPRNIALPVSCSPPPMHLILPLRCSATREKGGMGEGEEG